MFSFVESKQANKKTNLVTTCLWFALLWTICAPLEGYQNAIIMKQHEIKLFIDCSVGKHEEIYFI